MATAVSPARARTSVGSSKYRAGGSKRIVTRTGEDTWTFEIPIEALTKTEGRITIVSSRTFVPAERSGVADRRQLGLRVFDLRVDSVGLR